MKFVKQFTCIALAVVTMLSGAPAFAADASANATIWNESLWVEGNEAFARNAAGKQTYYLNKEGFVYVPLRTVAEWLGKDLSVNDKTFTLSGSKAAVYQEQLPHSQTVFGELRGEALQAKLETPVSVTALDGASVVLDGKPFSPDGKPVSVIRWENEPYIPIRTAAQMLGVELKFYRYKISSDPDDQRFGQIIFLRTALTDAQLKACKDYLAAIQPTAQKCLDFYTTMSYGTKEEAEATVKQWLAYMRVIKDTPKPDCRLLDSVCADIQAEADRAIAACEQVQAQIQQTDDIDKIRFYLREDYTGETYDMEEPPDNVYPLATLCTYPAAEVVSLSLIINQEIVGAINISQNP